MDPVWQGGNISLFAIDFSAYRVIKPIKRRQNKKKKTLLVPHVIQELVTALVGRHSMPVNPVPVRIL